MRIIALILAALCASPAALAQNWIGLLKNTPVERYSVSSMRTPPSSTQSGRGPPGWSRPR